MKYYETLYIVHPALESGRLKDIILSVEGSLKKMGGNPLALELWGKRRLAYFIDKQKYGTYVLVQYNGEGRCTRDFSVELEHNPNILAYITTSIEKDEIINQEKDLETQIAGKTRESERIDSRHEKNESKGPMPSESDSQKDGAEPINEDKLSEGDVEQINDENEDTPIKKGDNEQGDVIIESQAADKDEPNGENTTEERLSESSQEKAVESANANKKE